MLNVFLLFAITFLRLLLFLAGLIPQLLQKSRLLQQGADVNVKDANGQTPLFHALGYSSVGDCLYLLLAAGADENICDNDGMTAWEFSATCGLLAHSNLTPDDIRKTAAKYKAQTS